MFNSKMKLHGVIQVRDNRNNDNRYVTVMGGIPFYQSTGNNSGEKNTWFPYNGHAETGQFIRIPLGFFLKPSVRIHKNNEHLYFPEKIITQNRDHHIMTLDFLSRFGNFEAMCLSMIIGGGFWKDRGLPLKVYILENYSTDIERLFKLLDAQLNEIKKTHDEHYEVNVYPAQEPKLINDWLKEHGSKAEIKNDFLKIDFEFSDIQLLESLPAKRDLL